MSASGVASGGQWYPTRKGLFLPPELAAQVARAMLRLAHNLMDAEADLGPAEEDVV